MLESQRWDLLKPQSLENYFNQYSSKCDMHKLPWSPAGTVKRGKPMGGRGRKELYSASVHSVTHAAAMRSLISREYGKSTSYKELPQSVEIYT